MIGRTCDSCAPQYFNLVRSNPAGCEACDCFLDGTIGGLSICDMVSYLHFLLFLTFSELISGFLDNNVPTGFQISSE